MNIGLPDKHFPLGEMDREMEHFVEHTDRKGKGKRKVVPPSLWNNVCRRSTIEVRGKGKREKRKANSDQNNRENQSSIGKQSFSVIE